MLAATRDGAVGGATLDINITVVVLFITLHLRIGVEGASNGGIGGSRADRTSEAGEERGNCDSPESHQ